MDDLDSTSDTEDSCSACDKLHAAAHDQEQYNRAASNARAAEESLFGEKYPGEAQMKYRANLQDQQMLALAEGAMDAMRRRAASELDLQSMTAELHLVRRERDFYRDLLQKMLVVVPPAQPKTVPLSAPPAGPVLGVVPPGRSPSATTTPDSSGNYMFRETGEGATVEEVPL